MNRRELLGAVAAMAATPPILDAHNPQATVGQTSVLKDPASGAPALALFECDHAVSQTAIRAIVEQWEALTKDGPFQHVKAVVLGGGLRLTLLDASGQVLNQRLDVQEPA